MDDQSQPDRQMPGPAEEHSPPPVVTIAEFASVDFEAPIRDAGTVHQYAVREHYAAAARNSAPGSVESRVFNVLEAVTSIMLHPEAQGSPWTPMWRTAAGQSATPDLFRGEQSAVLRDLMPTVQHPALRARLGDIVWTNDRREGAAGRDAAEAYRQCVVGLLDSTYKPWDDIPQRVIAEATFHLRRMLQILHATSKKAKRPDCMRETALSVYGFAKDLGDYVSFVKAAQTGLYFELLDQATVAADAEAMAKSAPESDYPEAVKQAWSLAISLYASLGDQDAARRCRIGAFECTLAMRRFVIGNPAAEASWVMDGLLELRRIPGMEEREVELQVELRRLQKASMAQMKPFSMDVVSDQQREATLEMFENLPLPKALLAFALLTRSENPDDLKKAAREFAKTSPLSAMMGGKHLDEEGRTKVQSPGAPVTDEEPEEGWYDAILARHADGRRVKILGESIDPARMTINALHGIEERHLAPVVGYTPFVPPEQKPIMVLGFTRLFQGDFMSAAHLIIPQLEPCLRHILTVNGHDPSKIRDDTTEEDLGLPALLGRFRPQLEEILGLDLVDEIDRLFHKRPGPALRHEFAHGQISGWACWSPSVYYAMWLMYRICVLFIVPGWEPQVRISIEQQI